MNSSEQNCPDCGRPKATAEGEGCRKWSIPADTTRHAVEQDCAAHAATVKQSPEREPLLPCPFCGLQPQSDRFNVWCECGANFNCADSMLAAQYWNTRAQPTPAPSDVSVEEVREILDFLNNEKVQAKRLKLTTFAAGLADTIALIDRLSKQCLPAAAVTVEREVSEGSCHEADGCPTEGAVLKRFWRSHQSCAGSQMFRSAVIGWRENDHPEWFCRRTAEYIADLGRRAEQHEVPTTPPPAAAAESDPEWEYGYTTITVPKEAIQWAISSCHARGHEVRNRPESQEWLKMNQRHIAALEKACFGDDTSPPAPAVSAQDNVDSAFLASVGVTVRQEFIVTTHNGMPLYHGATESEAVREAAAKIRQLQANWEAIRATTNPPTDSTKEHKDGN